MNATATPVRLFAGHALLAGGWAEQVEFTLSEGRIAAIRTGVSPGPGAEFAGGIVLPAMSNLHSHAFQRAMAGFAEVRGPDDFWSWRRQMYALVARLDPDQLQAVAEQAYVEMLKAGYCAVGEFHYLHHNPDGRPYARLSELSERMIAAARRTGITITLLPVLYAHGGFGSLPPEPQQRRFVNDIDRYRQLLETLFKRYPPAAGKEAGEVRIGAGFHSLRAVSPPLLKQGLQLFDGLDERAPVHIHIAEQRLEVRDCLRWCGRRPVEWLLEQVPVKGRWCLVHATHINRQEIKTLAASGAVVGLCPLTEADLGDGIFPADTYLNAAAGRFGIGSDSQIRIDMAEELRWLEYGQRLVGRRRSILASPATPSVGRRLYCGAASGGAQALGLAGGALQTGARADLLVLDPAHPGLANGRGDQWLDALIFACTPSPIRHVMVAGRWQIRDGHHAGEEAIAARFGQVQRQLLQG